MSVTSSSAICMSEKMQWHDISARRPQTSAKAILVPMRRPHLQNFTGLPWYCTSTIKFSWRFHRFSRSTWAKSRLNALSRNAGESFKKIPDSDVVDFQNLLSSSFSKYTSLVSLKFSWRSDQPFLRQAVNRQTDRHTDKRQVKHDLLGGANYSILLLLL